MSMKKLNTTLLRINFAKIYDKASIIQHKHAYNRNFSEILEKIHSCELSNTELLTKFRFFRDENNVVEAHKLFQTIKAEADIQVYQYAIEMYCLNDQIDNVKAALTKMENVGLSPNASIVVALMKYHLAKRQFDVVEELYEKFKGGSFPPATAAFLLSPLMKSLKMQNKYKESIQIFEKIKEEGGFLASLNLYYFIGNLMANEEYQIIIDVYEYERNFEAVITPEIFSYYLNALYHQGQLSQIIAECSNSRKEHPELVSLKSIYQLKSASEELNNYSEAIEWCKMLIFNKTELIKNDIYYSSILHILRKDSINLEANELTEYGLAEGLLYCKERAMTECLLHLSSKDDEIILKYMQFLIFNKSTVNYLVFKPFLKSLFNQERHSCIESLFLMLRPQPLFFHPDYMFIFVESLLVLHKMQLIKQIEARFAKNNNVNLFLSLAKVYNIKKKPNVELSYYMSYLRVPQLKEIREEPMNRICDICCHTRNYNLLVETISKYCSTMKNNRNEDFLLKIKEKCLMSCNDDHYIKIINNLLKT